MTKMTYYFIMFLTLPFAVGASFHYIGGWLGWPALAVCGTYWLACVCSLVDGASE